MVHRVAWVALLFTVVSLSADYGRTTSRTEAGIGREDQALLPGARWRDVHHERQRYDPVELP